MHAQCVRFAASCKSWSKCCQELHTEYRWWLQIGRNILTSLPETSRKSWPTVGLLSMSVFWFAWARTNCQPRIASNKSFRVGTLSMWSRKGNVIFCPWLTSFWFFIDCLRWLWIWLFMFCPPVERPLSSKLHRIGSPRVEIMLPSYATLCCQQHGSARVFVLRNAGFCSYVLCMRPI